MSKPWLCHYHLCGRYQLPVWWCVDILQTDRHSHSDDRMWLHTQTVELSSHPALSDQSHDSLPNSSSRLNSSNQRLRPSIHSPNSVTQEGRCSWSFLSERLCLLSVDPVSFTLPSRPVLQDRLYALCSICSCYLQEILHFSLFCHWSLSF